MIAKLLNQTALIINDEVHILNFKSLETLIHGTYFIIAADKRILIYEGIELRFTMTLVKKVKKITASNHTIYICDKHGDMFLLQLPLQENVKELKETNHVQTNLAMPKCLKYFDDKIILGDSYSKIKIHNAKLLDEILQIWVPFEAFLRDIIFRDGKYYLLFKKFDEHENPYYEIHTVKDFNSETPELTKVFPTNEFEVELSTQAKKVKLVNSKELTIVFQQENNQVQTNRLGNNGLVEGNSYNGQLVDAQAYKEGYLLVLYIIQKADQYLNIRQGILNLEDHQIHYII